MSPKVLDDFTQQQREEAILTEALQLIEELGIGAVTMDKVVARVPYSKGTVYGHFSGKEDLLLALCNRGMAILGELFSRIAKFEGNTRERMQGYHLAYLLYALLYPTHFMLVVTMKTPGFQDKCTPERWQAHELLEDRMMQGAINIIEEAMDLGELTLPPGIPAAFPAFSAWAMGFGTIALLSCHNDMPCGAADISMEQVYMANSTVVLDGLRWNPMSWRQSTAEVFRRLGEELFSAEMTLLQEQGKPLHF
ncbi:TetR/AcrR family transcriptional regulator [Balneatrix alpica]|uniref:TetR/AcrR family transcriptional regulator n=1 Tax=Balneatrix alpica TaxID=75684 RepID=UPI002739AA49|nr:TetR/AcrR family transcriptional regulator [Balneatrix alpica]